MSLYIPEVSDFVRKSHPYRRILEIVDFVELTSDLKVLYSELGRGGYPVEAGFKALLLQFMEDLSDRELEGFLQENLAAKYFCSFRLDDKTPDHSYFGILRKRIGAEYLAKLFNKVRDSLKRGGLIREVFTFVDSASLISKQAMWAERDKAIAKGLEKLNNETVSKVSADPEARFGCKGKDKFWYGYKDHKSVDMTHGLINKVNVTPANVSDQDGLKDICPDQGMVFGDKSYCYKDAQEEMKRRGCHSGAILKNNMKGKDFRHDKWLSQVRAPYEGIFSKRRKRTRYRGLLKVLFQSLFEAMALNFKRLVVMGAPRLKLA